jgi:uncharacterized protein YbjT (DUF2867 family)
VILVTGATGTVGNPLVTALSAGGHQVRALVPDQVDVPLSWRTGVEPVVGDLSDPSSLEVAMTGVNAVYLLVPAHPRMAQYERNVIDVARTRSGGPRVVLHAAAGFDRDRDACRFFAAHAQGFDHLRASGLPWTVLAPNGFMQNVFGMVTMVKGGVLELPAGQAGVSYVDALDVAAAAATVLTSDGHENQIYTLTGPEAVTHHEIAKRLGYIMGHPVRYQAVTAERPRDGIRDGTTEAWLSAGMIELFGLYRSGAAAPVSDDLPRLLHRPPRSLDGFLAANAATLRGAERVR